MQCRQYKLNHTITGASAPLQEWTKRFQQLPLHVQYGRVDGVPLLALPCGPGPRSIQRPPGPPHPTGHVALVIRPSAKARGKRASFPAGVASGCALAPGGIFLRWEGFHRVALISSVIMPTTSIAKGSPSGWLWWGQGPPSASMPEWWRRRSPPRAAPCRSRTCG